MRAMPPSQLYEADFYAWTRQQAMELRRFAKTRPNLPLDLEHIAEEIQDLGKSERTWLTAWHDRSCSTSCSLSTRPQVSSGGTGWMRSTSFRAQIKRKLLTTIRRHFRRDLGEVYADGRRVVERKMRRYGEERAAAALPESCPYTVEQVLGDWLPETEPRSA